MRLRKGNEKRAIYIQVPSFKFKWWKLAIVWTILWAINAEYVMYKGVTHHSFSTWASYNEIAFIPIGFIFMAWFWIEATPTTSGYNQHGWR